MAWENDLLERKKVAEFLQNLLENDDDIKVVNIDSAWGSGKTFFLENWKEDLDKERGVVYFNAWERDYTGDPFVSLVSAIKNQLESQVDEGRFISRFDDFSTKASGAILSASPVLMKAIGKGLVRKLIGVDVDEVKGAFDDEREGGFESGFALLDGACEDARGVADEAAVKAVKSLIESSEQNIQVVESFREVFEELVEKVGRHLSGGDEFKPVYVLVDELDRCRPTYAIELLERIKHFLDVPGCKFVIATDTRQLCHSVRAVYGNGFNSFGYLKRFFDITYTLDNRDLSGWISSKANVNFAGNAYCLDLSLRAYDRTRDFRIQLDGEPVLPDSRTIVSEDGALNEKKVIILALCHTFEVSLRDIDKIVMHINASLSSVHKSKVHFFFLAYLVFLKNSDPEAYDALVSGNFESFTASVVNRFSPWKLYFTTKCVDVHELAKEYTECSLVSKSKLMAMLSNNIDGLRYRNVMLREASNGENFLSYRKVVDLASYLS
ncbi:KAP-like P-loop domain-containing protein [Chromohalobacter marismortui]|uniref:KAP-like P-loop domain-containing protein n=1 Tax=Chromohalobacter marismortui TaxID=42055 RepID=A0A4R7NRD1_9GAMM|nr:MULTISPECIES: P-loop NTPase fold protein [Chromohalobacter]MCI0508623.1 KAP family NTPase [Chromohalobacter sp.]TDU23101.1 KAP-like P-loop domain-containing protein [Chromohalobacter marismortui]